MKIGILTLPLHTNYGGILQAYALQTVLERMGHEVSVIQKSRRDIDEKNPTVIDYIKVYLLKYIFNKDVNINIKEARKKNIDNWIQQDKIVRQNTWSFIQKHFVLREIDGFSQLKENEFDAIIVGSDQIWRAFYIKNTLRTNVENAFLSFAENWNIKRIAYAASFGVDFWEFTPRETSHIKRLISQFSAVSTREISGLSLCSQNLGYKDAVQMPDPTLLLNQNDYESLIKNAPQSPGNLHCYVLDESEDKDTLINKIATAKGLVPFKTNSKTDDWSYPIEERIQPPIERWLKAFKDADFVITDSFHACVFSILFRKQFLVIGNPQRGMARFLSLLTDFGLEERLITNIADFDIHSLGEINYDSIYEQIDKLRDKATRFLEKSLL